METLLGWLTEYAQHAHYLIFGLLVLAGFSLPISEDILLVVSGALASTVVPEYTIHLFMAAFLGSLVSDCIAYGIGRYFGKKLYKTKWFSRTISEKKKTRFETFYQKHGLWVLAVGRCIPFGLRNGIFMTAGAGKMSFNAFLLSDGIACLLFSALLFYLAFFFGKNYETLYSLIHRISIIFFIGMVISVIGYILYARARKRQAKAST